MGLAVRNEDDAADRRHVPVMVEEVVRAAVRALNPLDVVDATLGTGGHAEAMLRATQGAAARAGSRRARRWRSRRERLGGFRRSR